MNEWCGLVPWRPCGKLTDVKRTTFVRPLTSVMYVQATHDSFQNILFCIDGEGTTFCSNKDHRHKSLLLPTRYDYCIGLLRTAATFVRLFYNYTELYEPFYASGRQKCVFYTVDTKLSLRIVLHKEIISALFLNSETLQTEHTSNKREE